MTSNMFRAVGASYSRAVMPSGVWIVPSHATLTDFDTKTQDPPRRVTG